MSTANDAPEVTMHATQLYPRRPPIARRRLIAAALAAIALAIPVRLAADDLSSGGGTSGSAATVSITAIQPAQGQPDWVRDPLASPLRQLQAPAAPTALAAR